MVGVGAHDGGEDVVEGDFQEVGPVGQHPAVAGGPVVQVRVGRQLTERADLVELPDGQ
jgi:hypothetical protein